MKKSIALALTILTLVLSLTGCKNKEYSRGNRYKEYSFAQSLHSKIVFNTLLFNKNNASFDIFIGVYDIDKNISYPDDFSETYNLTIYVSNSENVPFVLEEYNYLEQIESIGNAELIRTISYDEAFNTDFGYTVQSREIIYNHKEKILIPEKFFNAENKSVYIHVITLHCYDATEADEKQGNKIKVMVTQHRKIEIHYFLIGDKLIIV